MDYDLSELEERYEGLDDPQESGLNSYWSDIVGFLDETDRDWVRKEDIKDGQDIENRRFSQAYDAFLELFELSSGTGDAFAFFQMDYEDILEVGEELDLGSAMQVESNRYREFLDS